MWRVCAVMLALVLTGMGLAGVGGASAREATVDGVFGTDGPGAMGCAVNPMRLSRRGAAGPFVMTWAQPVAAGDGQLASVLTFREGRMQGRWLYLTNVGQDVMMLQFSEDFGQFVLLSRLAAAWTGTDDPRAIFRRCPAVGS